MTSAQNSQGDTWGFSTAIAPRPKLTALRSRDGTGQRRRPNANSRTTRFFSLPAHEAQQEMDEEQVARGENENR